LWWNFIDGKRGMGEKKGRKEKKDRRHIFFDDTYAPLMLELRYTYT